MPEALTLPHHLQDLLRRRGSAIAVRFLWNGAWTSMTWSELLDRGAAVAWAMRDHPRDVPVAWSSPDPGLFCATQLGLLHLGLPSRPGSGPPPPEPTTPAPRAYLQRLCQQLHPRDPAWDGLNQQELLARVRGQAGRLGEEALASTAWTQALGAAALEGSSLILAGPDSLPSLRPGVWLASTDQIQALKLPSSRLGPLGGLTRRWGRLDQLVGDRLQKVWVEGEIPAAAQSLQERGVQVRMWGI